MSTERNDMTIAATGNGMKHSTGSDTFLHVAHGDGNGVGSREVHLRITSNDGEFAQGWFRVDDVLDAIGQNDANVDAEIAEVNRLRAALRTCKRKKRRIRQTLDRQRARAEEAETARKKAERDYRAVTGYSPCSQECNGCPVCDPAIRGEGDSPS